MKAFDKLPYDIQIMVELEASFREPTTTRMARILGEDRFSCASISKWRKDPLYQAALQEKYAILKGRIDAGWQKAYEAGLYTLAETLLNNALERALSNAIPIDLDKQVRAIDMILKNLEKIESMKGRSKDTGKTDLEKKLFDRLQNSPSGQEYLKKSESNKDSDEERD